MRIVAYYLGILVMVGAVGLWIMWGDSECNSKEIGGCGIFDVGILPTVAQAGRFLVMCVLGTVGWFIFEWGGNKKALANLPVQPTDKPDEPEK